MDLLIDGQKWSAPQAFERGLVDAVVPDADFDREVLHWARGQRSVTRVASPVVEAGFVDATRRRIADFPPAYRRMYADCLDVMLGASPTVRFARHVAAPRVKRAASFFFVRQMAYAMARGAAPTPSQTRVHVADGDPVVREFAADLMRHPLRGLVVHNGAVAKDADYSLGEFPGTEGALAVTRQFVRAPLEGPASMVLWLAPGRRFFELATRNPEQARETYHWLSRAGCTGIVSRPDDGFVAEKWLRAFNAPQEAWRGDLVTVHATLHNFGFFLPFIRRRPAAPDRRILDALRISLLAAAVRSLRSGALAHPTAADVLARELLDFPLAHGSLLQHLTVPRVRGILRRLNSFRHLLLQDDIDTARQWLAAGRGFYQ